MRREIEKEKAEKVRRQVKALMDESGLNKAEFARRLGVTATTLRLIVRGERDIPQHALGKAQAMGVDVAWVLEYPGHVTVEGLAPILGTCYDRQYLAARGVRAIWRHGVWWWSLSEVMAAKGKPPKRRKRRKREGYETRWYSGSVAGQRHKVYAESVYEAATMIAARKATLGVVEVEGVKYEVKASADGVYAEVTR